MYNCTIQYHLYILDKDININIYGSNCQPILAFPTQNSKADNYENSGLIDEIADYINNEKIQVFVVDSIDEETWSSDGDKQLKSNRQEQYFSFIINEVLPIINKKAPSKKLPLTFGCSLELIMPLFVS